MWVLFKVPCPTPDGRTARDLYEKRLTWITDDMRASARELGCRFHRGVVRGGRLGVLRPGELGLARRRVHVLRAVGHHGRTR